MPIFSIVKSLRSLLKGRFARRMAMLTSATAIGQGLIVLSSPLLTRLYNPAEFGFFVIAQALIGIVGPLMALRYEFAIPICQDDKEAKATVVAGSVSVIIISSSLGLIMLFGGEKLFSALDSQALIPWLWLIWAGIFLQGIELPFIYWAMRRDDFRINSHSLICQSASQALLQVIFGFLGFGILGLILGYVVGFVVRLIWIVWGTPAQHWQELYLVDKRDVVRAAVKHWRYPTFSTLSTLLQNASQLLPAALLAPLFGPTVAGWYGLGQRMLTMPTRMIGQAARQVIVAEARHRSALGLQRLFIRVTVSFFLMALAGGIPLLFFAPTIFAIVFGEPWRTAGQIVQILVPLHVVRFVIVPVSQTLNMLNRQYLDLLISATIVAALAGAFAASILLDLSFMTTISLYSGGATLAYLFGLFLIWQSVCTNVARSALLNVDS